MSENSTATLDFSEFRRNLQTTWLGHPTEYFSRVTSTSDSVLDMARRGAPEGTLVVAEEQTAGRGRQGATWYSPPGCGIWASALLRPRDVPISQMPPLSMCAAYAVSTAIEQVAGVSPDIKWPNDVLLQDRKIAGIMIETETVPGTADECPFVILGMGINVNQTSDQFPADLTQSATSIRSVTGQAVNRMLLLQRVLEHFEPVYREFLNHGIASILGAVKSRLAWRGRLVELVNGISTVKGRVLDVDSDGSLIIDTDKDGHVAMYSGSLHLIGQVPCN